MTDLSVKIGQKYYYELLNKQKLKKDDLEWMCHKSYYDKRSWQTPINLMLFYGLMLVLQCYCYCFSNKSHREVLQ